MTYKTRRDIKPPCHENEETRRSQSRWEGSQESSRRRRGLICEGFQGTQLAQIPQRGVSAQGRVTHPQGLIRTSPTPSRPPGFPSSLTLAPRRHLGIGFAYPFGWGLGGGWLSPEASSDPQFSQDFCLPLKVIRNFGAPDSTWRSWKHCPPI